MQSFFTSSLHKILLEWSNQVDMDGILSTYGEVRNAYEILVGNSEGEEL
jgi:hypothetical protein